MYRVFESVRNGRRARDTHAGRLGATHLSCRRNHMYRPKFCAECSAKIIRLNWHFWTSRRFCQRCSPRFTRDQAKRVLITGVAVFLLGMAVGQAARTSAPPVLIQRSQDSILVTDPVKASGPTMVDGRSGSVAAAKPNSLTSSEEVYSCGARTRKGTACSRRVHGPVRCWQHLGLPAMLPQEQLRIKAK